MHKKKKFQANSLPMGADFQLTSIMHIKNVTFERKVGVTHKKEDLLLCCLQMQR